LPQLDHTVGQQGNAEDVIQVAVTDQNVIDAGELVQPQLTHAGTRIDQDVVVQQERRSVTPRRDGARAAQHTDHLKASVVRVRISLA